MNGAWSSTLVGLAVLVLCGGASAGGYAVVELPTKPAAKHGLYDFAAPVRGGLANDGRALVNVSTEFEDAAPWYVGELCKATGDGCKRLTPRDDRTLFFAASSNFKNFTGSTYDDTDVGTAFRKKKDVIEFLAPGLSVKGINDKATVVGSTQDHMAFVYDTEFRTLPSLDHTFDAAWDINNGGVVVGQSVTSSGESRAVRWDKGKISLVQSDIPDGKGYESSATVITPDGVIYGRSSYYDISFGYERAVRFTADGHAIELGVLGDRFTFNISAVNAANNLGSAVGWSTNYPTSGLQAAVLFKDGAVIELATQIPEADRAKYVLQWADAINDNGQILVSALTQPPSPVVPVVLRLDPQP